uniref:Uncharacterized protein n=1 Tax=Helicotheca tamesis TaxID=374047 RepID=A0A7S2MV14_9STRA|mmetsp:Transcript_3933/g.5305  ORF Transcript_3933/g.5305 Transcript_3933/m.5305 type:complete len:190 (+) Transcript_3933:100-669(+)|eukprot:CAMPEP_0185723730 /NCGR_PEP_ID=MMETSP1171-20130828/470_1 /TAXON_ID=374046 /ORGANISM="Helicotheca tamensis, Strain CCMP826" /LENGTH=189 /DNA_ID=CAMNT_0028391477 /DNA_START=71 /DNA_END=640 /DNA_ORIENTATION=+
MTSVLSPLAVPFTPDHCYTQASPEFVIFTNGRPSLVCAGDHPEHEILQGIDDEAIDELFPPNAEEAAEIEAAEDFVAALADISLLEDREERARNEFSHIRKRWEARREEGLRGKPHPARSTPDHTRSVSLTKSKETSIVPTENYPRAYSFPDIESRLRCKDNKRRELTGHKINRNQHKVTPIQQPRKHY